MAEPSLEVVRFLVTAPLHVAPRDLERQARETFPALDDDAFEASLHLAGRLVREAHRTAGREAPDGLRLRTAFPDLPQDLLDAAYARGLFEGR
jgi:hypothetical protein